jgi:hypothetical protein
MSLGAGIQEDERRGVVAGSGTERCQSEKKRSPETEDHDQLRGVPSSHPVSRDHDAGGRVEWCCS